LQQAEEAVLTTLNLTGKVLSPEEELHGILRDALEQKAIDISLSVNQPPQFRIGRALLPNYTNKRITQDMLKAFYHVIVKNDDQRAAFERDRQLLAAYSVNGLGRFRVSLYRQRGSISISLRLVPTEIWTPDQAGIPTYFLNRVLTTSRGLIIITGPTGAGKSTTLATAIETINQRKNMKVITLDNPIEYLHSNKKSTIDQRELYIDCISYEAGLESALVSNPDVIGVAEILTEKALTTTLHAGRSGHLVLSTFHSANAGQTLEGITELVPHERRQNVQNMLADTLVAIYSQQLLPTLDNKVVPALEILYNTPSVRASIKEGKLTQIKQIVANSAEDGMISMDNSIMALLRSGKISVDTAREYSIDRTEFDRRLRDEGYLQGVR
jgi:twitching motility protein PilT